MCPNPFCDTIAYIEEPFQLPNDLRATRIDAAVARSISKAEASQNKDAQEALRKEWTRLRELGTWNEKGVMEYDDVVAELKRTGKTAHFGRVNKVDQMHWVEDMLPMNH